VAERVRIGCSGWQYKDWRERFYPKGCAQRNWLEYYSRHFDTVEVNSTFYRLARADAVGRWVEETPQDFEFALKASRYLTHIKRLTDMEQGLKRYYESIDPLVGTPKLGPIVWQLPDNFKRDDERLCNLLENLPPGRHCVEFRNAGWFTDEVYELLRTYKVALAIGDHPNRPHVAHEITADWTLVRFHYGHRGRNGNYSATEIEEWAGRIRKWRESTEVFAYFNNDWNAYAIGNARLLTRLVSP
jgi:uncharacterized protein YecE (DUF72 family)